jgi:DNA-directed RNA polymerase subunit M/transcription elongation factor TFIIS
MPQVQENGIVSRLHYALTDSQCNKCGAQLEWKAEFDDINSPKYAAKHCGQDFIITVDTVKVELVKQTTEQGREENLEVRIPTENESRKEHQEQPNAITMAELLKDKTLLQKKTKLGDGSNIKAEDR